MGLIFAWGGSPGGGNGDPLQHSCLGNPMDGGYWQATVHGVAKASHWGTGHTHIILYLKCVSSRDQTVVCIKNPAWQSQPLIGVFSLYIYIALYFLLGPFAFPFLFFACCFIKKNSSPFYFLSRFLTIHVWITFQWIALVITIHIFKSAVYLELICITSHK